MRRINFLGLIIAAFLASCSSKTIDYNELSSFDSDNNLRAVIEIPAGTNDKIEFKPERNRFEVDSLDGEPRIIKFLPYPVNYGFIPSTVSSKDKTSDPLDVLVYSKPIKTGQIIAVRPIGILKMLDDDEADDKILSVPVDEKYHIIDIKNFADLSENHSQLRDMIAEWFLNYDKSADIKILGWSDESKALEIINSLQTGKITSNGE
jgi:inorganic pyrophosphatase